MSSRQIGFYNDDYPSIARRVMLLGATRADLADVLGVTEATIIAWEKRYAAFAEAMREGGINASSRVAEALFHRAIGYRYTEQVAVKTKEGIEVVTVEKQIPPDIGAIRTYLFNRDPDRWKADGGVDGNAAEVLRGLRLMFVDPPKLINGDAREIES